MDTLTRKQYAEILESKGYEIDPKERTDPWSDPWSFLVRIGPRSHRLVDARFLVEPRIYGESPGIAFENKFASGRFKYVTHGADDSRDQPCIEDYASDIGRKEWPDYYTETDSQGNLIKQGPKPFRNAAERRSYERLTNQRHRDHGEQGGW